MEIKYYSKPTHHIIIDNFLTDNEYNEILEEIKSFEHSLEVGKYFINGEEIISTIKSNKILWVDKKYDKDNRYMSPILNMISNKLYKGELFDYMHNHDEPIFNTLSESIVDHTQLSAYGNNDNYDWHIDGNKSSIFLTFLLMINKKPKKFTGGDLMLKKKTNVKTYKFKNNRVIIFPSNTLHKVTHIKTNSNTYIDNRFTIQNWASHRFI